jgi:glucose/arabinose dehydrogenase
VASAATTPSAAPQDIGRPYGKILRLDPGAEPPYAAAGNPFAEDGDARVFHYGLRNPFRFSFDRQTGDLYLGDVGQDTYEELDFAPHDASGLNFGWPTYEANSTCPGTTTGIAGPASPTSPMLVVNRSAFATGQFSDYRAITGGIVYRGAALPALQGAYVFGDYYGARLGALYRCGARTSSASVLAKACDPNDPNQACLPTPSDTPRFDSLTAIVEDHAGEIYFVANGNSLLKLVGR